MSTEPLDAAARTRALDPTQSFCVQAPAGSGKTELLTQRILALLAHCERPEEVLAITFTRKAAAEMRSRLLASLEAAQALDAAHLMLLPPHKHKTMTLAQQALAQDARYHWHLLQNPQRLRISTIDSFTSWLGARLPVDAGFGAAPQISTDMDAVFRNAVRETLATLEDDGHAASSVEGLLRHLHNDLGRAEALLMALLKQRDQWLPLLTPLRGNLADARQALEDGLRLLVSETLEDAAFHLRPLEADIMTLVRHAATHGHAGLAGLEDASALPAVRIEEQQTWSELAKLFLLADCRDFRSRVNKNQGFPAPSSTRDAELKAHRTAMLALHAATVAGLREGGYLALLQRLAQLPPGTYEDSQWQVLEQCIALLPLLVARLEAAMRHDSTVDHVQTSLAALRALGSEDAPTDLALRLDYRLKHILIDEFQDTSIMQFELLKRLTAGWSPGDGRTLFIVGDGMQSCYRFRNADVALFMRAREQVGALPMELLQLRVNFRSAEPIVRWVNEVFERAFPEHDDPARGGVSYSPAIALDDKELSAGVHTRLCIKPEGDYDKAALRARQAQQIATLCDQLQQEHPGESIAILVRNRNALDALVPALRAAGLRWNAEDIDPLLAHMPIRDLFTLLRALENPADGTAWFALLRSPLAGLHLADLEVLARLQQAEGCSLFASLQSHRQHPLLSEEARLVLARVMPPLVKARRLRQCLPLAELLENLWLELGGPCCLESHSLLPTVQTFFRLVAEAAPHGTVVDIEALEERLGKSRSSERDENVHLQIMTIHKAKGLEFEHVILPDLDRPPRPTDSPLILWQDYLDRHQQSRPLLALMTSRGQSRDALYDFLRKEAAAREAYETTRLLYVGVTRAIRSAWLFGSVKAKGDTCTASAGSLLATVLPALLARQDSIRLQLESAAPSAAPEQVDSAGQACSILRRLPPGWSCPLSEPLLQEASPSEKPEETHDPAAAAIGELVHLCLQQVVTHGRRFTPAFTPPWWLSHLRPWSPRNSDGEGLQRVVAAVHEQLQRCLQGPDADWLFHTPHRDDACELALSDRSAASGREYVVDRTFIAEDSRRWIVDYKTGAPAPGQSESNFLHEQSERYRPQLQEYARLLQEPGTAAPVLALYFTSLARLHRLD